MNEPETLNLDTLLHALEPAGGQPSSNGSRGVNAMAPGNQNGRITMILATQQEQGRHRRQLNQLNATANDQPGAQAAAGNPTNGPAPANLQPIRDMLEFPVLSEQPLMDLRQAYKQVDVTLLPPSHDTDSISGVLYLFHVIVALEWQPSREMLKTLMHGLRGASDALYDATNGSMVFGQVTFCGRDYMPGADIQIMASNRFHPRSTVKGLLDPAKFFPIRIGRGVWHKNNHVLTPWDEPGSFRAIAHEWAHYALSLHDLYIDFARRVSRRGYRLVDDEQHGDYTLVIPKVRLSIESLMATLEASEIVPLQYRHISDALKNELLNEFQQLYAVGMHKLFTPHPGPHAFPGALPQFYHTDDLDASGGSAEEIRLDVNHIQADHCWLYTLGWEDFELKRVIAQGTIDARAQDSIQEGYRIPGVKQALLGATHTDQVLAFGHSRQGHQSMSLVLPGKDRPLPRWTASTIANPPVIAVVPGDGVNWPEVKVGVRLVGTHHPEAAWLALPGTTPERIGFGRLNPVPFSQSVYSMCAEFQNRTNLTDSTQHLDGLIVLKLAQEDQPLWVAEYSHGGNPPTSVRSPAAPISAGSADGNLMIFSRDEHPGPQNPAYETRIVTTRNYGGFEEQNPGEPCGYLFSVAANQRVDFRKLHPTIVLYYDADVLNLGGDLVIFRYDESRGRWREVPTYLPPGAFYAAAPMDEESAPNLVIDPPAVDVRVEYYRLFAIPPW